MSDKDKERIKSLYKLYGTAKFKINPKTFDNVTGNQNSQIKDYMNIIFFNNLKTKNYGYYIISFLIIIIFIFIYLREIINEFIQHGKDNWSEYKCDPRFIPYGGYIVKNDNKTEFESTEENFYECIKPITEKSVIKTFNPYNDLVSGIKEGTNSISSNVNKFSDTITNIQGTLNDIKEKTTGILSNLFEEENNKNQATNASSKDTFGSLKKLNTLVKSINQLFVGANYTTQSTLTYVYGFFEGALVLIAALFILFVSLAFGLLVTMAYLTGVGIAISIMFPPTTIAGGLAIVGAAYSLQVFFWIFVAVSLGFFCMFIAVVAVMILYKGFLKEVFGIDVDDRKTKTPDNPF